MLSALLRVRLRALFSGVIGRQMRASPKRSPLKKAGFALLLVYVVGCLLIAVTMVCWQLAPLIEGGLGWLYFALLGVAALAFCLVGGMFAAQSQIFEAKDNELMLSMPIPPGTLLLSRLLPLLLLNAVYGGIFLLPAGAMYFYLTGFDGGLLAAFLLGSLLLILLGTAAAALFGWLLSALTARMRRRNLVSILLSFIFLGGYFYLYSQMNALMTRLLANGASIAESIRRAFPPAYFFGRACAEGSLPSLALLALCCLIPAGLAFVLLQRSLLRIMTARRGFRRVRYRAGEMPVRSPLAALYRKEAGRFFSSPTYLMNCGIGNILLLCGAGYLLVAGGGVLSAFASIGLPSATTGVLAVIAAFTATMSCTTGCSLSLEGSAYPMLRAMPIRPRDFFGARVLLPISLGVPCALLAGLAVLVRGVLPVADAGVLVLFACAVHVFSAVTGMIVNLHFPKLDWTSEVTVIKQSMASFLVVFGGMGLVCACAMLYLLLLGPVMGVPSYLLCLSGAFLLLAALGWHYLLTRGERRLALL